jgi:hypothetical protein
MKGHYQKVGSVKKTFPNPVPTEQYEQPIGPPRPTAMQRFEGEHQIISGAAKRVKDAAVTGATWMQKRGQEIQRDAPRSMPRSPLAGLPRDPFGTSRAVNPFGGGSVPFSAHPFNDRAGPIRDDQRPPRKVSGGSRTIYRANGDVEVVHATISSRKRKRRDRDDGGGGLGNPMGIPKSMRHLF